MWRYATGGAVDREIAPQIAYSAQRARRVRHEVAEQINRPRSRRIGQPDAGLAQHGARARTGSTVGPTSLRSRCAVGDREPRHRTVSAPVDRVKPEVTTDELAQQYPIYLTVDRAAFQLRLWKNLKLAKTYTIAVGQQGLETPAGAYTIETSRSTRPGTCPTRPGPATSPAR